MCRTTASNFRANIKRLSLLLWCCIGEICRATLNTDTFHERLADSRSFGSQCLLQHSSSPVLLPGVESLELSQKTQNPVLQIDVSYADLGFGNCALENGMVPRHSTKKGHDQDCASLCTASVACLGYSASSVSCLLWEEGPLRAQVLPASAAYSGSNIAGTTCRLKVVRGGRQAPAVMPAQPNTMIADITAELAALRHSLLIARRNVSSLTRQLAAAHKAKGANAHELVHLRDDLLRAREAEAAALDRIRSLQTDNRDLRQELEEMEEKLDHAANSTQEIARLQQELNQSRIDEEKAIQTARALQDDYAKLEHQLMAARKASEVLAPYRHES